MLQFLALLQAHLLHHLGRCGPNRTNRIKIILQRGNEKNATTPDRHWRAAASAQLAGQCRRDSWRSVPMTVQPAQIRDALPEFDVRAASPAMFVAMVTPPRWPARATISALLLVKLNSRLRTEWMMPVFLSIREKKFN